MKPHTHKIKEQSREQNDDMPKSTTIQNNQKNNPTRDTTSHVKANQANDDAE
jgi:hypothetical protein